MLCSVFLPDLEVFDFVSLIAEEDEECIKGIPLFLAASRSDVHRLEICEHITCVSFSTFCSTPPEIAGLSLLAQLGSAVVKTSEAHGREALL